MGLVTHRTGETRLLPGPLKFIGRSRMVYWRAVSGSLNVLRKKAVSSMKFSQSYLEMDQRSIFPTASFFIINPFIFPLNATSSNSLQHLKKETCNILSRYAKERINEINLPKKTEIA